MASMKDHPSLKGSVRTFVMNDDSGGGGGDVPDDTQCTTLGCAGSVVRDAAKKVGEVASDAADVVDDEAMDCVKYCWAGGIFGKLLRGVAGAKALPGLDRTGKVHGALPKAEDLSRYSRDELRQLHQELGQSVQERIRKTSELGPDRAHGQRQAAEQQLMLQIEKFLSGS